MPKPNTYPADTRGILLTNVNNTGDDVMVFTSLALEVLKKAYASAVRKITYDEIYEVPERDYGYYLYEPCHLTLAEEAQALKLAAPLKT